MGYLKNKVHRKKSLLFGISNRWLTKYITKRPDITFFKQQRPFYQFKTRPLNMLKRLSLVDLIYDIIA